MTTSDLAREMQRRGFRASLPNTKLVIAAICESIMEIIIEHGGVTLDRFGRLRRVWRSPRQAQDQVHQRPIHLPAQWRVILEESRGLLGHALRRGGLRHRAEWARRLTAEDVAEIRRRWPTMERIGRSHVLAREYGVGWRHVYRIVRREKWRSHGEESGGSGHAGV